MSPLCRSIILEQRIVSRGWTIALGRSYDNGSKDRRMVGHGAGPGYGDRLRAYLNTERLLEANRQVRHTHEIIEGLEHVLSVLKDAETGQRGFIITGEDRYLEPYDAAVNELPHDMDTVHDLLGDDTTEQASLQQVQKLSDVKLAEVRLTIELRRKSGLKGALPEILTDRGKKPWMPCGP